jgi:putative aldouronate transport system substrate-binding protein
MYSKYFIPQDMVYPSVYFLADEQEELALLNTDVRDYVKQMRAKFIMGAEPLTDAGWNNYVQTLNRAGLARYLEIYQQALDRYYR